MKPGNKHRVDKIIRQWFLKYFPKLLVAKLLHQKVRITFTIDAVDVTDAESREISHYVDFRISHKSDFLMSGCLKIGEKNVWGRYTTDPDVLEDEYMGEENSKMALGSSLWAKS